MASRVLSRSLFPRLSSPLLRGPATLRPIFRTSPIRGRPQAIRFTATSASSAAAPPATLSQSLKALSKEYGYSAVGVYLGLSALDFPFCFLAVRYLGAERIGRWEEAAVGFLKPYWNTLRHAVGFPAAAQKVVSSEDGVEEHDRWDDIGDAEKAVEKSASTWTELALAYAIHKSFIFIRVPLTAAVTPRVVKVLRGWGWDIGRKGKPKIGMPGKKKSAAPPPPPPPPPPSAV